jgi:hypothetical protein
MLENVGNGENGAIVGIGWSFGAEDEVPPAQLLWRAFGVDR